MSSSTDWVAVTISPKWNSAVTNAAGLASIFSAKSDSDAPRGMRMTVEPSPRGMMTPPNWGACMLSNSSRRTFLLLRAFDFPPCLPNAPAAPPRPPGPPRPGGPPRPAGAALGAPAPGAPGAPLGREPGRDDGNAGRPEGAPPGPDGPPGPPARWGLAAKPGRTPPGPEGRLGAPAPPGRGAPGLAGGAVGRDGGLGMPGVENGLLPGRAAVGLGDTLFGSVGDENGLLPGRGGLGAAETPSAAGGAVGVTASTGAIGATWTTGATGALGTTGSIGATGALGAGIATSTSGAVFLAVALAGAFLAGASAAGAAGYSSRILRTTGGSTVDDAERTNSPSSWSFARTTLLSMPSSFASS
ncbi:hypothetical protein GALL_438110 [mine drainage metagenome]|uniref:Collagen triple helix repeat (20 copies) n=1 Tax=mine drainage metagenome TaxID=410659 RepID=A0A1J5PSS3_9ZZZZ